MAPMSRGRRVLIAVALPALLALSGCSSDQSALCQSVESLQSSVQGLRNVDLAQDGLDALTQQLDDVESSLSGVKQEAGETFATDVKAVESAVGDVEGVVQKVQGGASIQSVAPDATSALASLYSAIQGLITTARDQNCDL